MGEVNDNIVWEMVVLLVIRTNWVFPVDYFNDCSNGPIVQAGTWKDVPVPQGDSRSHAYISFTSVTVGIKM